MKWILMIVLLEGISHGTIDLTGQFSFNQANKWKTCKLVKISKKNCSVLINVISQSGMVSLLFLDIALVLCSLLLLTYSIGVIYRIFEMLFIPCSWTFSTSMNFILMFINYDFSNLYVCLLLRAMEHALELSSGSEFSLLLWSFNHIWRHFLHLWGVTIGN